MAKSKTLTKNTWLQSDFNPSVSSLDLSSVDVRNFGDTAISQLSTAHAVDKTLRNALRHKSHQIHGADMNSLNASRSLESFHDSNDVKRGESGPSSFLVVRFWETFRKFGSLPNNSSRLKAMALQISSLLPAIKSLSPQISEDEVTRVVESLGLQPQESLSWAEFRDICCLIFSPRSKTAKTLNTVIPSPTKNSFHASGKAFASYDVLMRRHRTTSISDCDTNTVPTEEASVSKVTIPSVKKDALCDVLKEKYRQIKHDTKTKDLSELNILDRQPRFMADLQKTKIAGIVNKSEMRAVKWREMAAKRKAKNKRIDDAKARKEMLRNLKTVVIAQERTGVNNALLSGDQALYDAIESNIHRRVAENKITERNINHWRQTEYEMRCQSAAEQKAAMQRSTAAAKMTNEEEKKLRLESLNRGMKKDHSLSSFTSSKFELPQEISDRIKFSKRYSAHLQAKEEARLSYEREMSNRIATYTTARKEAVRKSETYGCPITLNPIDGADYFAGDPDDKYFDSTSYMEYPPIGDHTAIRSAPVYIDPNYSCSLFESTWRTDPGAP
mmetsp:Transcript_24566/g.36176  ORF Transcript_24566/g.36176 Transcript_24566/m.36176 type:complete len:557 (+) Transcript_24566:108-1778(+)|eukprot:CAMPEP_0185033296 /NCGR_PEP_ID=MMETSP1103-20130426/22090_1 /TAXON_ID=36769 /ORGANISM="Paraphysomonas bandaiensis, Strain Caron Lab Isolate" /LENGTH=556 /DNA_ID=CAMNT_0027569511 /DNA_START=21 /DNA_END=1691 /DNA_ORIENTATION=-